MSGAFEAIPPKDAPPSLAPLDRVGWLAGEGEAFRDWAARAGRWRRCDAGQFVYHAGDRADGLYGLAEGALELTFPLVADEPVTLYRAEVGFWIGDNAELSDTPRLVGIVSAVESRVFHIPGRAVVRLLAERPEHWRTFHRLAARNMDNALRMLSEVLALTVRARVCRRLLVLAQGGGDVQIVQTDLAMLVGVTRSTLRRVLASLAEEGGIERRYGVVRLLDARVLERFVDEQ